MTGIVSLVGFLVARKVRGGWEEPYQTERRKRQKGFSVQVNSESKGFTDVGSRP